jgi:hypothetical protein
MAPRIAGRSFEPHRSLSEDDLRLAFQTALSELHEADKAAKRRTGYRAPIVQHGEMLVISQADAEKRALSNAARALAQLWKV